MAELISAKELAQLAGTSNTNAVEDAWMQLAESPDTSPTRLCEYAQVVGTLAGANKLALAETLTWTLVEGIKDHYDEDEVIRVAGACLLAIGESRELRGQVSDLYRARFGSWEGFESLLIEAGLPGGRPVRRALRTLDVCLSIEVGSFLVGRDTDEAARVESLDPADWTYTLSTRRGEESLGAVPLADRFRPAREHEFAVQKQFDAVGLRDRMDHRPDAVVIDLCRENGDVLDSDRLMDLLCPPVLPRGEFKKWWTKARAALKKCPQIRIAGRSPYVITYDSTPVSVERTVLEDFNRHRDPFDRYAIVVRYIRECPGRGSQPDRELLATCHATLVDQARGLIEAKATSALVVAAMASHIGDVAGADGQAEVLRFAIDAGSDLRASFGQTVDAALLEWMVDGLEASRPQSWRDDLLALIPTLPQAYLDRAVERLRGAGVALSAIAAKTQDILKAPTDHFEALLWLWDGPAETALLDGTPPETLLLRMLRALNEVRVSDLVDKAKAKTVAQRARSVLSARKFERFVRCIESLDGGMAVALKTQLTQAENLGPAARDAMLRKLQPLLPKKAAGPAIPTWAMEDVLYATEAGLVRKDAEIEHHVHVKMKENARAIGAAAEKGDLSENSEYKFALEERDLLQARLAQMNTERAAARVLSPADVPTDHIGIGTRAVFKAAHDGSTYEMTFVGPWEADLERGLFNYRAPLAQQIMGSKIGDTVDFEHAGLTGTYEVVELHNALRDGTLAARQKV